MTISLDQLGASLADRYVIQRELGAGGMATVYLAEDLKHQRQVAIKVLKPELAAVLGAERFVQEITTTAALQHPHILPLFDSGEADGFLYYVMPYIEGETLRSKLDRDTQLGVDEAIRITTEVADALDYAHRHGVIHRDIKPENILLHDGRPMVADFGIALALSAAAGGRMTETGMSLGTPHYMSPEQATADKEITGRSDIYSLASVTYEMLAGNPPHTGSSAQQIIMKIVTENAAPVTSLRRSVPPNVAAALEKALEKVPADRFATARDFADALANPAFTLGRTNARAQEHHGPVRRWLPVALGAALVGALALAAWGWLRPTSAGAVASAFQIHLTPSEAEPAFVASEVALTPDGSAIVFSDSVGGVRQLWIKRRNQPDPQPIPGTRGGRAPFLSPDGSSIAFSDGVRLLRIPLAGGSTALLSDSASTANFARAGVWLDDGTIVIQGGGGDFLLAVGDDGRNPHRVITNDALRGFVVHLSSGPRPRTVLATVCPYTNSCVGGHVELLDLDSAEHATVLPQASGAWSLPGRRLLYVLPDGSAYVARFQDDSTATGGEPVLGSVLISQGGAELAVNASGTVLYSAGVSANLGGLAQLVEVGPSSEHVVQSGISAVLAPNTSLDVSPDGRRVLFSVSDPTGNTSYLAVSDLAGGPVVRLTSDGTTNIRGVWHPDGRHVAWISDRGGRMQGWLMRADGTGEPQLLATEEREVYAVNFSPDAQWLLYRTDDVAAGKGDILARRVTGDTSVIPIAASAAEETSPAVSPDGRWVAFTEGLSGTKEVIVRPFPNVGGGRVQVSAGGGTEPVWARDGKTLYYWNYAGEFVAARVSGEDAFRVEQRKVVARASRLTHENNDDARAWALMPDGSFLLVYRPGLENAATNRRLMLLEHFLPAGSPQ